MHDEANQSNVVGYASFVKVWLVLVVLTLLLVGVSATLGGGAAVLTMLLVTPVKASLVGYYFMDLRHEGGAIRNMVFVALAALVVFIGLFFSDFLNR
jgi:caa(3)-type oxidase subunit IV